MIFIFCMIVTPGILGASLIEVVRWRTTVIGKGVVFIPTFISEFIMVLSSVVFLDSGSTLAILLFFTADFSLWIVFVGVLVFRID